MTTRIETKLFCLHCEKETPHIITYSGNFLSRVLCERCGTEVKLDRKRILETYTAELIEDILTKPRRLTEEMRRDLTAFLTSLPLRIITKPYRVIKDILEVVKED